MRTDRQTFLIRRTIIIVSTAVFIFALGFFVVYVVTSLERIASQSVAPQAPYTSTPSHDMGNMPGMDMNDDDTVPVTTSDSTPSGY